jgi:hypothetical protein
MSKIAKPQLVFLLALALALAPAWSGSARAQIPILDIIGEAAKKAVMAIDLHVQQLQTETIGLQEAQKELENEMHLEELAAITGWLEQQKELYAGYYQELRQVKVVISDFQRVADMLRKQGQIAVMFKQMQSAISQDHHFPAAEVATMTNTLTGIVNASTRNISALELAIQSLVTQMHDADRLRIIDEAGEGIDKNYADLQEFYQRSLLLSLDRAQGQNDVTATKVLYGLQ